MNKSFNPPLSVEQFAAYLDGNFMPDEMKQISSLISENTDLCMLTKTNAAIERTLAGYSDDEMILPEELQTLDFDIPELDSNAMVPIIMPTSNGEVPFETGHLEDGYNTFLINENSDEPDTMNHLNNSWTDDLSVDSSDTDINSDRIMLDNNDF